ncbi:MAG TPA: aminoglycoside adenylyltransferase domain-containing protein [Candidatus Limnocylindrales bacterium]|nr:aminoglycoside adenylyltransferase domain-containing protein [Candidatus Limnocylindrales bacterium]
MTLTVSIDDLAEAARAASLQLRDELVAILGDDLVGMWLHGGTTFADRPARAGDLDIGVVIASVAPNERNPGEWRSDPRSRPSRIYAAQDEVGRTHGVEFDTMYLLVGELGRGTLPSAAFRRSRRETAWAVYRAHWLAGQYVLLHGRPPEEFVAPPTKTELFDALDRELEHLERHVYEGDADNPFEATYAIWNGCRILYTLATGSPVISKRSAGAWALDYLPGRWHDAIRAAGRSYDGAATADDKEDLRATMAPFIEMVRQHLPPQKRRRPMARPRWS